MTYTKRLQGDFPRLTFTIVLWRYFEPTLNDDEKYSAIQCY